MKPEDLENIIKNNGVYILTKEQMQGILAQMNRPPTPTEELGRILAQHISGVSVYREAGMFSAQQVVDFDFRKIAATDRIIKLARYAVTGAFND